MKDESEVCTIIKNSFIDQGNYLYKIPDPSSSFSSTIKRDFDMFGRYGERPIYIEVKYLNGLQSFNLKRIEEHQFIALKEFKKVKDSLCYIVLGVHVKFGDNRIYFWDVDYIYDRYEKSENILAKELKTLPFYTIKKNLIVGNILIN
jgi:penicillin-binding protein-related factor A (putative recombinase)